ncbi:MAG TPA: hypothetical protein DF613_16610 [Lachnospiraceae bacterium]|nr:hypothetical protein [Lachnospiraceae bacterium]
MFLIGIIVAGLIGALVGLIPYFLGRYMGKPELGQLGMIFCTLSGMFWWPLSFLVMLGFLFAIFMMKSDVNIRKNNTYVQSSVQAQPPIAAAPSGMGSSLQLDCLSGPLKGQRYVIGAGGLMFGRDTDCHVRFPAETPGISRHHCCIRWQNGMPVLTDLNSTYGTFLSDGRQLMPNNPMQLMSGTRFQLSNYGYLFQVVMR